MLTKDEIEAVIKVLNTHIQGNKFLLESIENITLINSINFESGACEKTIKLLEAIGGVEND